MRVIVVIASPTRGFTTPRDGTPTVINPCPSTQDQDEKASVWGKVRLGATDLVRRPLDYIEKEVLPRFQDFF